VGDPGPLSAKLQSIPGLVFDVDGAGTLRAINDEWTRLTGQSVAAALGSGWRAHVHPDDVVVALAAMRDLVRTPSTVASYDARLRRADGAWVSVRAWLRPELEAGVVRSYAGVAVVLSGSAEVERLEAHNDALIAALPDLLLQVSADGVFIGVRAPQDATALYGHGFLGRSIHEVLPAAVAERTWAVLHRARETNSPQRYEYQLAVPERGLRDFEGRAMPMRTGTFLFLVRDVTEQKRAEAELIAAREQALQGSRHKTQFLANVSHEIRTPLNGILGVTQLLRTWTLPKEAGEYLDVLQTAGESLLGIVNDVLDLSKIEANRLELEVTTFDGEKVVAAATRAFAPQAQKKGLTLDITIDASARGPLRGDPARLRQVVNNLVGNAVKFTDTGAVRVRLARIHPAADMVVLEVTDTGPGIAADLHERIFEPFVQAEGTQRRFGGTGLGLSITRRLARLMGGDVSLTSTLGAGTTFSVTVSLPPVVIDRELAPASWRATPPPRPMKVLLAEDNAVNAAMTSALIARLGHKVDVVNDGKAALEAVATGAFDLVIMDVQMPVLDGLQATRRIRDGERGSANHIPIVALTANAMKGDDLLCLSAGMDAYLPKPVTVEALKDVLSWFSSTR
jgi:signal transduction histidine kinase/ActR/RegA family two-component response regulator